MTRAVKEWIGKTPDTRPPERVISRLFLAQSGNCAECKRRIGVGGEAFDADHTVALINGGENRETNLRLVCTECHTAKTREDVAQKSAVARKAKKHRIGTQKRSTFQTSRSGKYRKKIDGTVERRDEP